MKQTTTISKSDRPYFQNAEVLHSEFGVTPLTITIIQHGFHHPLVKKLMGEWYLPTSVIEFNADKINWYISPDFFRQQSHFIVNTIKKNPAFVSTIINESKRHGRAIHRIAKQLERLLSGDFSRARAFPLVRRFIEEAEQLCAYGFIPALSDLHYYTLTRELNDIVEQYCLNKKVTLSAKEYVSVLINPTTRSAQWYYKRDLFRLAKKVAAAKDKKTRASFLSAAKGLAAKHFAVNYGHRGPGLTAADVQREILEILKKGLVRKQEATFLREHQIIRARQKAYARELGLSTQANYLLGVARDFIAIKSYRLEKLFLVYATLDKVFLTATRGIRFSINQLKRCSLFEVFEFFRGGRLPPAPELARRGRHCTYTAWQNKSAVIRTGWSAQTYLKSFVAQTKDHQVRFSVHGNIACSGKVQGKARILQGRQDMYKVEAGDILIAIQTSPELLPAMKRAAAFVTDIGGITSHAAIVSREMNKPCVIGTRVATKVFKDGDMVEVDAERGIVKKI